MDKFFNRAIIGNKNIVASYSEKGELQRFCYPDIDGRQFIDFFRVGLKINDSGIIYLHDDINNTYDQKYITNTNVLVTKIENSYFKLKIEQTDCISMDKNVLVKKYIFTNDNNISLDLRFIITSKILSSTLGNFGSKIFENGIMQYNHNYAFNIFSKNQIDGHRLNDVPDCIQSGILQDKDYIGMSNEVAISYNIGVLQPGEHAEFFVNIWANKSEENTEKRIDNALRFDESSEIDKTINYWQNYLEEHCTMKTKNIADKFNKKILEIYHRTILLYPLLINYECGGVAAALEVDDERCRSGGYRYCWTRDAIFITKAFDLLKMKNETELFYNKFCRETQSQNGMWEQRFFTDGRLAPCWGYQIDETASVVYGIYEHYKLYKQKEFLQDNLKMCENAVKFLIEYVEHILNIDDNDSVKNELKEKYKKPFNQANHISYDLWEMHEGIHLYSLCSIIASFNTMKEIYSVLENNEEKNARLKREKRNKLIQKLTKYCSLIEEYIKENLIDRKSMILKRNTNDKIMDISVMGAVYPFNIFDIDEKVIRNTVDKINMTLRTYTGGYLRFEDDSYMNGTNPWVITTLWMALYYIRAKDITKAEECFKYVVNTSAMHGFLSEQVSNEDDNFQWVIGLGWSHAMFIIVLDELLRTYEEGESKHG